MPPKKPGTSSGTSNPNQPTKIPSGASSAPTATNKPMPKTRGLRNLVHAAVDNEAAEREIDLWFGDGV